MNKLKSLHTWISKPKNLKLLAIIFAVVAAICLLFVFALNGVKNSAITLEEQIMSAQSDIDIQEKRRADLLPNLADCVKQYDKHEYETLVDIIEKRNLNSDSSAEDVMLIVNAVAESYPELKSNENYKELMKELSVTENLISNYRTSFNKWVKKYNQYVRQFPNKQILSMLNYDVIDYKYLDYNSSADAPTNLFGD